MVFCLLVWFFLWFFFGGGGVGVFFLVVCWASLEFSSGKWLATDFFKELFLAYAKVTFFVAMSKI